MRPVFFIPLILPISLWAQSFGPEQVVDSTAMSVRSLEAMDLDGDGDTDIISYHSAVVHWYANNGVGGFTGPLVFHSQSSAGGFIVSADLDGDQDLDVIAGSPQEVIWQMNLGPAGFGQPQLLRSLGTGTFSPHILAKDMDSDNDVDIIVASNSDGQRELTFHENTGSGQFTNSVVIDQTSGKLCKSICADDLDGDGDTDLIISQYDPLASIWGENSLSWYENYSSSVFGQKDVIQTSGAPTYGSYFSLQPIDVDGDADIDIVFAAPAQGIKWLANDGSAQMVSVNSVDQSLYGRFYCDDLDGDGDMDVVGGLGLFGDDLSWFENDSLGSFGVEQPINLNERPHNILAADLDGDNDQDVIFASNADGKISWHENLITDVGIEEGDLLPSIRVFPNPYEGSGTLIVENIETRCTIEVVACNGVVVSEQAIEPAVSRRIPINRSGLSAGYYMIRIISEGVVTSLPFVVQ